MRVSAAAAIASRLLLAGAIGGPTPSRLQPTIEDYPPQDKRQWFSVDTNTTFCSFRNMQSDGIHYHKWFDIRADKTSMSTRCIRCPATGQRPEFFARYKDNALPDYYLPGNNGSRYNFPYDVVGGDASKDPLKMLHPSTFHNLMDTARAAMIRTKSNFGVDMNKPPLDEVQELCSAIVDLFRQFWSYEELCDAYYKRLEEAVKAGGPQGWQPPPPDSIVSQFSE
ncbi:hypothetical protein FOZ60_014164 [Perkinsus olseni]|uniref:Uncharacterized protein n=2 Tax=Perkinsus olseni TaxID=32597 RepID=A0A7J6N947_PEROL|nr:hypothetical protein FOZ60_014164 [Perkinsus olseni]